MLQKTDLLSANKNSKTKIVCNLTADYFLLFIKVIHFLNKIYLFLGKNIFIVRKPLILYLFNVVLRLHIRFCFTFVDLIAKNDKQY